MTNPESDRARTGGLPNEQPRPQGFSLKNWVGRPGDEVA